MARKMSRVGEDDGMEKMANELCDCRNEYYNSKAGRMADEQAAAEATAGGSVRG